MKKKLLAFLLVAMVAVTVFAVSASAATQTGNLGTGISYTFDEETGVMTISGTGAITKTSDYVRFSAKKIVIEEGITAIPAHFFRDNSADKESSVVEVTLPSTLTSIPASAFRDCNKLTTVNIPSNSQITSVGDYAFYGCSALTEIAFNDNLKTIGQTAFRQCINLVSADLGNNVTSIGHTAFRSCTRLQSVTIGGTYTEIPDFAFFQCVALVNMELSDTVTTIGASAFRGTKALTAYTLPANLTTIKEKAFADSALTSITIPNTVTSFGEQCFKECTALTSVKMSDNVTVISAYAFLGCPITAIELPANLVEIGPYAFARCASLTSIAFNEKLTTIGDSAFKLSGLTSVTVPANVTTLGPSVFRECPNLETAVINANVTKLDRTMFKTATALKSVTLSDTILTLELSVFHDCTALTSVNIPAKLQAVGTYAFYKTTSLAIDLELPATLNRIHKGAFFYSGITSLVINSVEKIDENAFNRCSAISNAVVIPNGCISIAASAFAFSGVTEAYVPASVTTLGSVAFRKATIHPEESSLQFITDWVANDPGFNKLGDTYIPEGSEPACTHANVTVLAAQAPTCTATGLTEGSVCADCGETITAQEVIPATGHTYENYTETAGTPWEAGKKVGTCACGDEDITEIEFTEAAVGLDVVVNGNTATATLTIFNAPDLTSVKFYVKCYGAELALTEAKTLLTGYTADPALVNPTYLVWVDGLKNVDINGNIATFTYTVTLGENGAITDKDFTVLYEADDVCAINEAGELENVALTVYKRVTVVTAE